MDLFLKSKTKKDRVFDFIKCHKWVKTSKVIEFGLTIYHTRADRDARDLAEEACKAEPPKEHDFIRRMDEARKNFYFGPKIKEDIWEYIS